MKQPTFTVDIDRLVLTDLDLPSGRTEQLRAQVTDALQRILAQDGGFEGLASSEAHSLNAPAVHLVDPHGENRLANNLAQSIVQALRSTGQVKGEGNNARI